MSQTKCPIYVFGLISVLLAGSASAQTAGANTPRIDQRQANQEQRIDQGIASGSLTGKEAKRLDHQQHRIDTMENRAKADGTVTAGERKHLTHAQNSASHNIKHQKRDRQAHAN